MTTNFRLALLISSTMRPDEDRLAALDEGPRRDYIELGRATGADIVDYGRVAAETGARVRASSRWIGRGGLQALWALRHRDAYELFFSDSERVGLPLAAFLKLARASNRHIMVGHWLTPIEKAMPLKLLRLHSHIDSIACRIAMQRDVAEGLGVPPAKLAVVPRGVDERFWRPLVVEQSNMVCATGLERRDYATLIEAVRDLSVETVVTASSPWFSYSGLNVSSPLPPNVERRQLDFVGLRKLYAQSRAVVVPLFDLDFQAGITVILETMAMGRPVIVSRTQGQIGAGVVRHMENGLYVTPGDVSDLRAAITYIIENPNEAERMGQAGRRLIEQQLTLDHFVARIRGLMEPLLSERAAETAETTVRG